MLVVGVLLAYAAVLGVGADRLLSRAGWVVRSPAAALCVWHTCAAAFLIAVSGAAILLAHDIWEPTIVWLLHATEPRVHTAYAGTARTNLVWDALALALFAGAIRLVVVSGRLARVTHRERSMARLATDALTTPGEGPLRGVRTLEHPVPAAFCLPGRRERARIVLTSAAVRVLGRAEIAATVEHERAHLQCRHHRIILLADVVTASVGWCGALRSYAANVRRLTEMVADDHAAHTCGSRAVASALLELCAGGPSVGLLAMTGSEPAERVRRLLTETRTTSDRAFRLLSAVPAAALFVVPSVILLAPALSVVGTAH